MRSCLAILSSLLLAGSPVQGRSVEIHEVIQNSAVPAGTLGRFTSSSLIASVVVIPNEQEQSRVEKSAAALFKVLSAIVVKSSSEVRPFQNGPCYS